MKYFKDIKYTLVEDEHIKTGFRLPGNIQTHFMDFNKNGDLWIKKGYCWDGCSGPAIDTKNNMTPGLVHDANYQLMRHELLDIEHRPKADELFREMCRDRGMWAWRANLFYKGVDVFGRSSAMPKNKRKVYEAP